MYLRGFPAETKALGINLERINIRDSWYTAIPYKYFFLARDILLPSLWKACSCNSSSNTTFLRIRDNLLILRPGQLCDHGHLTSWSAYTWGMERRAGLVHVNRSTRTHISNRTHSWEMLLSFQYTFYSPSSQIPQRRYIPLYLQKGLHFPLIALKCKGWGPLVISSKVFMH